MSTAQLNLNENDTTVARTMLDILNVDCWLYIFSYLPIKDLIRSERVSQQWRFVAHEYLKGYRVFKISWWPGIHEVTLRQLLTRLGESLTQLYIDDRHNSNFDLFTPLHYCYEGDICPNLEELIYQCDADYYLYCLFQSFKNLKSLSLSLSRCNGRNADSFIITCIGDSSVERLTLLDDHHVTGQFLTVDNLHNIKYLAFRNCMNLNSLYLENIGKLFNLTTLKIDQCDIRMWCIIPRVIGSLFQLKELSLCHYSYPFVKNNTVITLENSFDLKIRIEEQFCDALSKLSLLKHLSLSNNTYVTNDLIKMIAQTCKMLVTLDVSFCNGGTKRVDDKGVLAVCRSCGYLRGLTVSRKQLSEGYAARLAELGILTIKDKLDSLGTSSAYSKYRHVLNSGHALIQMIRDTETFKVKKAGFLRQNRDICNVM